jgi:hypothetical protein
MFGNDGNGTTRELAALRRQVDELRQAVGEATEVQAEAGRKISQAVLLLAKTMEEEVRNTQTTTQVVLGLMRVIQTHYGHDKIDITPFGADGGQLA